MTQQEGEFPMSNTDRSPMSEEGVKWAIERAIDAVFDPALSAEENAQAAREITRVDVQEALATMITRAVGDLSPDAFCCLMSVVRLDREGEGVEVAELATGLWATPADVRKWLSEIAEAMPPEFGRRLEDVFDDWKPGR
jgi:hypothetical protein